MKSKCGSVQLFPLPRVNTTKGEKSCLPKGSDKGGGQGKIGKGRIGVREGRREEGRKKKGGMKEKRIVGRQTKKPRPGF